MRGADPTTSRRARGTARSVSRGSTCGIVLTLLVGPARVLYAQEPTRVPAVAPTSSAATVDGKSVAEWSLEWQRQPASANRDEIAGRVAKAGAAVVPEMIPLLEANGPATAFAIQVLAQAGDAAAPALPKLVEILRTRDYPDAKGRVDHL